MPTRATFTPAYATMRENLIALRKSCGISQVELAKRLDKEQPFISRIERGERRIDVVEFFAIAKALGLDPANAYQRIVEGFPDQVPI